MSQKSRSPSLLADYLKSVRLFTKKCVKPSGKEFAMSVKRHAIGIGFLGILGYAIKLIHIPINNIIVSNPNKE
ncbi:protein transport Sec61-like protein [Encephalitozoon romaleae SJ-2008]|uniref:Protein transport Sec61-like protein n=1 Tax=Encephalitozoon romaleae (strain SJ-2008) TaxID=1178016 RepID=I7ARL9_ENCRO|nr:protein transport Sec61-like protein [Encephalitozoon romaleae SJ-2008]AFN83022.1 protein transport Sec61-like protein [Encephalitozoon romaleae SJ-2008]